MKRRVRDHQRLTDEQGPRVAVDLRVGLQQRGRLNVELCGNAEYGVVRFDDVILGFQCGSQLGSGGGTGGRRGGMRVARTADGPFAVDAGVFAIVLAVFRTKSLHFAFRAPVFCISAHRFCISGMLFCVWEGGFCISI